MPLVSNRYIYIHTHERLLTQYGGLSFRKISRKNYDREVAYLMHVNSVKYIT